MYMVPRQMFPNEALAQRTRQPVARGSIAHGNGMQDWEYHVRFSLEHLPLSHTMQVKHLQLAVGRRGRNLTYTPRIMQGHPTVRLKGLTRDFKLEISLAETSPQTFVARRLI